MVGGSRTHPVAPKANLVIKPSALFLAGALAAVVVLPMPRPAQADTGSTIAIAAAAALIVGVIITDSNNQPYYVSDGRHVYVSQDTASYYRSHGNSRNQYSSQQQQWNQQQWNQQQQHGNQQQWNQQHGNQQHGNQYDEHGGQQGH